VHPFHPLNGERHELLDRRSNWGEDRVMFHDREGSLRWLPASWTSVVGPDPFVVLSAGRALFRVEDLLALVALVRVVSPEEGVK
jgi:hypothetical protein